MKSTEVAYQYTSDILFLTDAEILTKAFTKA